MAGYLRPTSLDEALAALGRGPMTVLAGGTDFYPARVGRPLDDHVLDVSAIRALRGIEDRGDHWRIGACTTWSDVAHPDGLPACFDGLRLAAREVGGAQVQNAGTVGGNLCNASPAADGVPPLLSLDARVELSWAGGVEVVPLGEFVLGNRRTARRADQLLVAVLVPRPAAAWAWGGFLKLGARRYLVISIVMVAGVLEVGGDGRVAAARVAVGACSEVARRLPALEARLVGRIADAGLGAAAEAGDLAPLAPIDDVRADAAYRLEAALTLLRRMLAGLGARRGGG